MGVSLGLGVLGSWGVKSTVPLAAACLGGLVTSLYIGPVAVIYELTQNILVLGLISIIGLVLGILIGFTVLEWFAGQQGVN